MAIIKLRNQTIDVDIESELRQYEWTRPHWLHDRLQAASPMRYERNPSFFILTKEARSGSGEIYPAGTWSDQGADDPEWASGSLPKLLAFLRNETYEESVEYLLYRYGVAQAGERELLVPRLEIVKPITRISDAALSGLTTDYMYLNSRGISDEVQRQANVMYDKTRKAIAIPWYNASGHLVNVKYRRIDSKVFWYEKGAVPIRDLVYGIELASKITVICEAEIDAHSYREVGVAAIAVGGSSFSEAKRDIIRRSRIETLIIITDNDKAGAKLRKEIAESLRYVVKVRHGYIEGAKDANEALQKYGYGALKRAVLDSRSVAQINVNLNNVRN